MSSPAGAAVLLAALLSLSGCGDAPEPAANVPPFTAEDISRGRELFRTPGGRFGCHLCHGRDLQGGNMGPSLQRIGGDYRKELGSEARARARFAAHLKDPIATPALRKHGRTFLAPMPSYARLTAGEIESLTAFLMSLD